MAIAWFICPYKRNPGPDISRDCAMNDFTPQIFADGGKWAESEILGDCAVVKVNASAATITTINAAPGFTRIPLSRLDDMVSSLTQVQRDNIRNRIINMGYSIVEIRETLGDDGWGNITLRDVLRFVTKRRRKPRYDAATDTIVCDGPIQPVRPLEHIDAAVS